MFTLLDETRTLETKYKRRDPASIATDPLYTTYGPYAICSKLQEEHGKLISDSDWPALATKLPESNTLPVESVDDRKAVPPSDPTIQCYKCKQFGHKANNPNCPLYHKSNSRDSAGSNSARQKPKDPWKYVEPKDLSKPIVIDGKEWYFCTKCKCRATGKVGYYQLSHTDETHDPDWRPQGNSTPVQDPDPTPSPPLQPPSPTAPTAPLDDDLVFTGVNCAPVLGTSQPRDEREKDSNTSTIPTDAFQHRHSGNPGHHHVVQATNLVVPIDGTKAQKNVANCVFCVPCTETTGTEPLCTEPKVTWCRHIQNWSTNNFSSVSQVVSHTLFTLWYVFSHLGCSQLCSRLVPDVWYTVQCQSKYWTLLSMSSFWYMISWSQYMMYLTGDTPKYTGMLMRIKTTRRISRGYPAKWLIFTGIMFYASFWNENYFNFNLIDNFIINNWMKRNLSTYAVAHDSRCTWKLLYDYNYNHWDNLCGLNKDLESHSYYLPNAEQHGNLKNLPKFYDCLDAVEEPALHFFDSVDSGKEEIQFDFFEPITHIINTLPNQVQKK